jgi:hypothetical protein
VLRRAERAHIGLQNPKVPERQRVVDPVRDRAYELRADRAVCRVVTREIDALAGHLVPAQSDVAGDVGDQRPGDP